jgi:hypothetical protein
MINRHKLSVKLLELFNEKTGLNTKVIKWAFYHLINWPIGVSLHLNHLRAIEVLTVFRHLDRIKFVKVLDGEIRTATFTDGTVVNANYLDDWKKKKYRRKRKARELEELSNFDPSYHPEPETELKSSFLIDPSEYYLNLSSEENIPILSYQGKQFDNFDFDSIVGILGYPIEDDSSAIGFESLKHYDPNLDSFFDSIK